MEGKIYMYYVWRQEEEKQICKHEIWKDNQYVKQQPKQ